MLFLKTFSIFIFCISLAACEKFRFDNYSLFKILPENDQQYKVLQDVQRDDSRFDFWTDPLPLREFVNVMTSPGDKADLEEILQKHGIKYEIVMKNIQEAIDDETVSTFSRSSVRNMEWNVYYNLSQINGWLDNLVSTYPNIVSKIVGGVSYEGRKIEGIKISHGSGRRAIFIESGIHAREWISPATTCYIINELLTSNYTETVAAARDYDWYIFPVTNPDGYVFSHEQFRMWRKNRQPYGSNFGVDLNRNWNNNWLVSGSSTNPALDTYAGPGPFSEPETRSLSTYIASIADQIDLYIATHSFGHLLLLPFGNSTQPYGNYHDAMNIGRRAMGALSVRHGTIYRTGNIAEAIYMATGGSVDWVKEQLRVPLVYVYEFRDDGTHGFLLPPDQIIPNSEEVMDSLLELIHQAKRFGYLNSSNRLISSTYICLSAFIVTLLRYY
ncbi:zinc carboxypeptidase-like [Melitaea cinxia]|uniref:zinc carboxypeptidase-like n=1 Tax=Melitaea cinxia TaxID=113334 RepID=UPI001E27196B|nr:zinc carboxypeptidase-like [Melitaea cinxia]